MSKVILSQSDANALLKMKKCRIDDTIYHFPELGGSLRIPLQSENLSENFMLDIQRMTIQLKKNKFQLRGKAVCVLARLDLGGPLHRNPDGEEIPCPHIHIYKEGFDDKWAYPLFKEFTDPSDIWKTFEEFMSFCNVIRVPIIEKGFFI